MGQLVGCKRRDTEYNETNKQTNNTQESNKITKLVYVEHLGHSKVVYHGQCPLMFRFVSHCSTFEYKVAHGIPAIVFAQQICEMS